MNLICTSLDHGFQGYWTTDFTDFTDDSATMNANATAINICAERLRRGNRTASGGYFGPPGPASLKRLETDPQWPPWIKEKAGTP